MKTLTITMDALPMPGGVARYIDDVARALGPDSKILADLRLTTGTNDYLVDVPYTVTYEPFFRNKWPRWMGAVHTLGHHSADVVMTHHVIPLGLACLMHKRRTGKPYIVFLHGMDFDLAVRNPWKRWLTRQVLCEAVGIVTNTQALARRVERFARRTPLVIHPLPAVQPSPHHTTDDGKVRLISVARLVERKGIDRVLKAVAASPHRDKITYTILGGDGPARATIEALIEDLDLTDRVKLTVNATDDQIKHAYEHADLFVLPTRTRQGDREGFGIVYREAALAGLPSIASRVEGVDEAVIDGETGVLVDSDEELGQAIDRLCGNEALRQQLGHRARKLAVAESDRDRAFQPLKELLATL
ncbi:MAG: glycosyltransferase family 4 protein [Patescibacteria group bacterium]